MPTSDRTTYSYRRYRDGDAGAINALYLTVTGIRRSLEEFSWQWLQAPGGVGEIWLIEATHPGGSVELVGHHGLMPVRFTRGPQDLLFGKTENTMVLPEYRRKFLYPRMEQAFAREYEARFDALFSTTGPGEAIRQRAAMRYSMGQHWVRLEQGGWFLGSVALAASRLRWLGGLLPLMCWLPASSLSAGKVHFEPLDTEEARDDGFFDNYWQQARAGAGLAPARFREDLEWRFWNNPHVRPTSFVSEDGSGRGLGVVDLSLPSVARILDWSFDGALPDAQVVAFHSLLVQLRRQYKVRLATFATTDDAYNEHFQQALKRIFRPTLLTRLRRQGMGPTPMPRKVTARGAASGIGSKGWQVTPMLFEGR